MKKEYYNPVSEPVLLLANNKLMSPSDEYADPNNTTPVPGGDM